MGIEVDLRSLGLGFGAGVLTTLAVQRAWQYLQRFREDDAGGLDTATRSGRSGHRRYSRELVEYCQTHHTYGSAIRLEHVLIEPRFIPPAPITALEPDEDDIDIYGDVPIVHDHPYLYAPYNIPTLRIRDMGKGENTVVILGRRGSGRTTALQALALFSLGQVKFTPPQDSVMTAIEEELSRLKADERRERLEERRRQGQFTTERLAKREGMTSDDLNVLEKQTAPALQERSPLLVDAFNLDFDDFHKQPTDPAEPLVRALQYGVSNLTRRTMARTIYRLLMGGDALVLIDNMDYLPQERRVLTLQWLRAFIAQYNQNLIFVTYDVEGYHPLVRMGFAPVFVRAWHDQAIEDLADKYVRHWERITQATTRVTEKHVQAFMAKSRVHAPFELLMRMRGSFAGIDDRLGAYVADYIAQKIGRDEAWSAILGRLGQLQLDTGMIALGDLVERAYQNPLYLPGIHKDVSTEETSQEADREHQPTSQRGRIQKEQMQLMQMLEKAGLIAPVVGGYRFIHHALASYCASLSLEDEFAVQTVAERTTWYEAIGFVAERLPIDRAVATYLYRPREFSYWHLTQLAGWLAYAGEDAGWRQAYLRQMGNLILAPQQYQTIRERLIASLISTRDRGVTIILQRAFQSDDKALQKTACFGLGAIENRTAVTPLVEKFGDSDMRLQIDAALALSAIRDEEALEILGEALMVSANEYVRRAIAEALAGNRATGYPTLYDAVKADEMLLRRAAIFGLGRIETDWALIAINEAYQRDGEEYYVQSAAEVIFLNLFRNEKDGVRAYPELGAIPWLVQWGAKQAEAQDMDDAIEAVALLDMALVYRDETAIQVKAMQTARMLTTVENVKTLYAGLFERKGEIRNEAHRTLTHIEMQLGRGLPAPKWA